MRPPALLVAACILAYATAWPGAFQFDDFRVITGDPDAQQLAQWLAAQPGMRPLLKLSFIFSHTFGGSALPYLLTNVAIHLAASLVLWQLLLRWLPAVEPSPDRVVGTALLATLIFALHPAQTEAVSYLSGRSISLMTLFALLSIGLTVATASSRWRRPLAALALVAALLVRESAVVVPLVSALLLRTRGMGWRDIAGELRWQLGLLVLAAAALMSVAGYPRLISSTLLALEPLPLLRQQVDALAYLLLRAVPAIEFSIDPDGPRHAHFALSWWVQLLMLVGIAELAWKLRPRSLLPMVGLAWCAIALAPYYTLLLRDDWVSVRHLYLAMPGVALAVAALLLQLPRKPALLLATALCTALLLRTADRNLDYRSELALWQDTVETSPDSARAWNNLGYAQQLAGDNRAAIDSYQRALALDPAHVPATFNLESVRASDTAPRQ